ncbi:hypothetical protein [Enterobacter ludwigii]
MAIYSVMFTIVSSLPFGILFPWIQQCVQILNPHYSNHT